MLVPGWTGVVVIYSQWPQFSNAPRPVQLTMVILPCCVPVIATSIGIRAIIVTPRETSFRASIALLIFLVMVGAIPALLLLGGWNVGGCLLA